MRIKRVALEYIADVRMYLPGLCKVIKTAKHLKGVIELKQRFRPELPLAECFFNSITNLWVIDLQEAADVGCVVRDYFRVRLEDIHNWFLP